MEYETKNASFLLLERFLPGGPGAVLIIQNAKCKIK